ncbi:MAG: PEP-CTERM sorting domain-containing protein [Burkholderiaceae bacterium]|nr:PEP-CTERM sorting domain-containing protein [Burkholderiaceae bacterium]
MLKVRQYPTVASILVGALLVLSSTTAFADPVAFFSYSRSVGQSASTPYVAGPPYYVDSYDPNGGLATSETTLNASEGTAFAKGSADLGSGKLKALAQVTSVAQAGYVSAFQRADIGDSFRSFQGASPFIWSGNEAAFTMTVTGSTSLTANASNGSQLFMWILEPGRLDYYARWLNGEATFSEWNDHVLAFHFGPWPTPVSGDITIPFNFAPGMDFDWALGLIALTEINSPTPSTASGVADFFNTLDLTYAGPAGATTYSASGLFPETLNLADAPQSVDEPSSIALLTLGLVGMGLARRRYRLGE